MKALFFQAGRPLLADVPPPGAGRGRVEVELHYSAVSPGTEMAALERGGRSALSLALEKRRRVDRLWVALRRRDLDDIRVRVRRLAQRASARVAPGYSAAGVVRSVGEGVERFAPGDRVAVAGAGYAQHADIVSVPVNLVVPVPGDLDLLPASTVALGAIALQAVRRAEPRIGETTLVLGLGMLGQLTARILHAGGGRVLGWDPQPERAALAAQKGCEIVGADALADVPARVAAMTNGMGADQVIVAAAAGATATEAGARSTRRSGTLVLLGDTPVAVERSVAYERELTIRLSTSYGPGRYDPSYEEAGIDYPFAHVRWTENRNLSAWLDLLASGRVMIDDLLRAVRDLEDAAEAYVALRQGTLPSLGLIFRHRAAAPERERGAAIVAAAESADRATVAHSPAARVEAADRPRAGVDAGAGAGAPGVAPRIAAPLRVAMLGTGEYASGVLLPALAALGGRVRLELLAGTTPARRDPLAQRHAFPRTLSSYAEAAVDPGSDLVVIATRHDDHAALIVRALEAGHAVYCEKPIALTADEVERVAASLDRAGAFLAVGFNRRFAPAVTRLRAELSGRRGPLQVAYRVQAGRLPREHWIRGAAGGGRLIGECVHMIDLCRCLTGAPLVQAWVAPGGAGPDEDPAADNFVLGLRYADGSLATILYTSRGAVAHAKERIEVHADGRSLEIDNFIALRESGRAAPLWSAPAPQKGQPELWRACVDGLLEGRGAPIPAQEILETSRAAIALEAARRSA
jgi:predicted dehydrogenase/threonine dehydrogenase-like Zn-dependent dehydrogenase